MAELIVVGFKQDMYRASEALNLLKDRQPHRTRTRNPSPG